MKTIKRKISFVGITLLLFITLYGCDVNSFLNSPAQGTLSEDVLANKDGVEGNLTSAYAMLDGYATGVSGSWPSQASNWIYGSVASDNAHNGAGADWNAGFFGVEMYQWGTSGTDNHMNTKWTSLYEAVNRTNATLELLSEVEGISQSERDRITGEAKFLRAHYHFEAWKMWHNIPYITEANDEAEKSNIGSEPISKILADLEAAISNLPPSQSEVGRVTSWTARAYKGRVQVYSGNYEEALTTLRQVINNGPYELEDNFWEVFAGDNDNGSETVLAFQASVDDGDPNAQNGNEPDELNFPHSGSPFGCCGTHQPSQNLLNAFRVDPATGLPLAITDPNSWNNRDDNFSSEESAPVDPRLDWTVGRDGVPYLDWGKHQPGWIRDRTSDGPYSPKKNIWEKNGGAGTSLDAGAGNSHSKNLHLLRYADVLLLLAEAEVEASGGSLENARQIVNQIRMRAAQAAQGPTDNIEVPIDDPSTTWANYQIGTYDTPWTNREEARKAVRMERRLELAMEGHRLFDLQRWSITQEVLNNYIQVEQNRRNYLSGASQVAERHNLYPIPTQQIQLMGENLKQNPGW